MDGRTNGLTDGRTDQRMNFFSKVCSNKFVSVQDLNFFIVDTMKSFQQENLAKIHKTLPFLSCYSFDSYFFAIFFVFNQKETSIKVKI
jgi:hypothetical protein